MTDTKPAREPGWYWVRMADAPDEWVIGRWMVATTVGDYWETPGFYTRGSAIAEIDERRITRPSAPAEGVTITEAQVREIAEAWEELSERYGFLPCSRAPTIRRVQDALRAAGIIGGEHD